MITFPTDFSAIQDRIQKIQPVKYAKSRNFLNGAVTYLSPYISRGVISTRTVFEHLKTQKYDWEEVEKLVQELAWRDFFQLVWIRLGEDINSDIKNTQEEVKSRRIPQALLDAKLGITGVDQSILDLYTTSYMHNHARMYAASIVCNVGKYHWRKPAQWMYYHLLDADWASNACSWQWVAGSFSSKKYFANQENINKYCKTQDQGTYLDVTYEELPSIGIPGQLSKPADHDFSTDLPETNADFQLSPSEPTFIYNWYNLDPNWHKGEPGNRVLLLEPETFERYPISEKSVKFMVELSHNIPDIQTYKGSFSQLKDLAPNSNFIFKEHPLNQYEGVEETRSFLVPPSKKNFNSFFGYWKSIEKELRRDFEA